MRSVSDTIARLAASRRLPGIAAQDSRPGQLEDLGRFGPNPGGLVAKTYLPPDIAPGAPLVVVLHGCTQTAAGYDIASGWSSLADEAGFALLYPEQQRSNNPNLCFNWFNPSDTARGTGEVGSIVAMIEAMLATHGLDRRRVFVTGLSAGGAMAAALLATHPELFAGGGIVAGLPHGVAATVPEAFDRMRGHGGPGPDALRRRLESASPHDGPWPVLSIWHGTDDRTVDRSNAEALLAQWHEAHGLDRLECRTETIGPATRRVWRDAEGINRVESYTIPGMGHGTPLDTAGPGGLGAAAPFMLDVGLNSTRGMAAFWGLADAVAQPSQASGAGRQPATARSGTMLVPPPAPQPRRSAERPRVERPVPPRPDRPANGITQVIEDALRKAGLMR
jgi:poly(hydroxyalkanoate) depolymerase family esterase